MTVSLRELRLEASMLPGAPTKLNARVFATLLIGISRSLWADGLPLEDGRYAGGPVLVFQLTEAQKASIEHFRTCHLDNFRTMNVYTPYVFTLTASQSEALMARTGFSPLRFEVYETYRGFNEAGPHWNLALRFSENEIEVPLNLLRTDQEAAAEHRMQGWKTSNPCFPALDGP
ncbi:MAG: hypothetical protein E6Q42_05840 [Dechloromonas sp.]|jgi:hypothetical protein|nr:MAG: hypothetical protein E6Q42_05840 [Dechloromonas sp.]